MIDRPRDRFLNILMMAALFYALIATTLLTIAALSPVSQ